MASRTLAAALCLLAASLHARAEQNQTGQTDDAAFVNIQKYFAEAYNRGDVDAMAAAFAENGVRVTPSGIFQGRDAIRRNLQDAVNMGLHDYTVRRTLSRSRDGLFFNAGEWQAKLGDKSYHGYYTAILVREGDEAKIMEETVTIAAP
jgi:ketosteroid isomerase-like protein